MIVQVVRGKYTVRLEAIGFDIDRAEKSVLTSVLLWVIGFLIGCKNLEKLKKKDLYVQSIAEVFRVIIKASNKLLDSMLDS